MIVLLMLLAMDKEDFILFMGMEEWARLFIWKVLSASLCSEGKVVVNVASSSIASLLFPGGRTAHSTFAIPLQLHENSICNVRPNTPKVQLLKYCSLIIWGETLMINK